jgi:hypothetical protein
MVQTGQERSDAGFPEVFRIETDLRVDGVE